MSLINIERIGCNQLEKRWILSLPGAGCSWIRQSGGCYMCNFKAATDKFSGGRLLPNFIFSIIYKTSYVLAKNCSPNSVIVFNGGSFLNDKEIPLSTQKGLAAFVNKRPFLDKLIVESRPEFVTEEKISLLKNILGDKTLVIAIGLESRSDAIRNRCINKGFLLSHYETAVEIIKNNNAELLTYVLLKPIFLSEKKAILEAINTVKYAFNIGSSEVDLESACVVKGTKMESLYNQGKYKPPWLWSIIEVVQKTHNFGHLHIGGFDDNPKPIAKPFNCPDCSSNFPNLIREFNFSQDFGVFEDFECKCRYQWQSQLAI